MGNSDEGKKKRPVIGIMTGSFHTDYSKTLADVIRRRLSDVDAEVILYQTLDASRFLRGSYVDPSFDRHYYSIFEYSRFVQLDLLIVSYGTISAVPRPVGLKEFLSRLPDVPVILLETEEEQKNCVSITIDNYGGMKENVAHLISEHGFRKIVYISGPENVADSAERLRGYRDAMANAGIPVTDEMIAWGDFTEHIDHIATELLVKNPDAEAVVCASDEMAVSAYRAMTSLGKTPGKDIAVTGFDGSRVSRYLNPPLTTVEQNIEAIADAIVTQTKILLSGGELSSMKIPTRLVRRASCGCTGEEATPAPNADNDEHFRMLLDRARIKRIEKDTMLTAYLMRNLMTDRITTRQFFQNLGRQLAALDTERSRIFLLKEPLRVRNRKQMFVPDEVYLYMSQDKGSVTAYDNKTARCFRAGEVVHRASAIPDHPMAVLPLFYGDLHYGMIAVELSQEDLLFYYTLALEIGNSLRYLLLAQEQQATQDALAAQNIMLEHSAYHDELTGCLNRQGIMGQSQTFIRRFRGSERLVAVMADLDHLKQINDTFGHAEGDFAIQTAAKALRFSLPRNNILGRTGGDEFTAVFHIENGIDVERFRAALKEFCELLNGQSGKPYFVEVSVGCEEFLPSAADDLSEHLKVADERLYEDKQKRRESVMRDVS